MQNVRVNSFLLGRFIVAIFYLFMGSNHFMNLGQMSGYAASQGVPLPTAAVAVSGALLVIAGISIAAGFRPNLGIAALVLFFVPVTFMMHKFWAVPQEQMQTQMVQFMKNMALLGSGLMYLAIPQPWPKSVDAKQQQAGDQAA